MQFDPENLPPFFWLHIKKSAGQSTRAMLQPHYQKADRSRRIQNFPESPASEWNDILNNYRVPLGAYQFRRCLYAKSFLYGDQWDGMLRFAFSRDPLDRCISAFFYLGGARIGGVRGSFAHVPFGPIRQSALQFGFDRFLSRIESTRESRSNAGPYGLHFATHTAAMWPDVSDEEGNLLLSHVFDLKDMKPALELVFAACNLPAPDTAPEKAHRNKTRRRVAFRPSPAQIAKVEALYGPDFALHHDRTHRF